LDRSRKLIIDWSNELEEVIACPTPNGAYYAFVGLLDGVRSINSMDLVRSILDETSILVAPGTPFGRDSPPHFRIAYGNLKEDELLTALERLSGFLRGFSSRSRSP
jgi:aspartate/methionine/tyrosine aminotransferase